MAHSMILFIYNMWDSVSVAISLHDGSFVKERKFMSQHSGDESNDGWSVSFLSIRTFSWCISLTILSTRCFLKNHCSIKLKMSVASTCHQITVYILGNQTSGVLYSTWWQGFRSSSAPSLHPQNNQIRDK